MNVLIVDDEKLNLKLLRLNLEGAGLTVHEAGDGVEALALLERVPVDAIISDILMPRMDGYQLCQEVRANPRLCNLPFIAYTATYTAVEDEALGRELGADAYLHKPALVADLLSAITKAMASPRRGSPAPAGKLAANVMEQYNARLVAKLEAKQVALERSSEELRMAHERLQLIMDLSPAVIYMLKLAGETIEPIRVSENIQPLMGIAVADATYEWWASSVHPDDRQRVFATRDRLLATLAPGAPETPETGYEMEYRLRHRDGSYRWIEDRNRMVPSADGRSANCYGVWTDVTERKQADEAIGRLSDIVASSDDAIIGKDLSGVVTSWNAAAEEMFGYSRAEMIGRSVTKLIPADRADEEQGILERIGRGERVRHFETQRLRKDGSQVDVSVTVSPIKDAHGAIVGASKILRDISTRKQMERLRSSVALSLSHELNTPLSGIVSVADLVQSEWENLPAEELRGMLEVIQRSAARLSRQVRRNLNFAELELTSICPGKAQAGRGEVIADVGPVVSALAAGVAGEHERPTDLTLDLAGGTAPLSPTCLTRVMTELVDNAFKFSRPGTPVRVTGRPTCGGYRLVVQDAGRGMSPEDIASVGAFVQFDRARHEQQGVGLGLHLARGITNLNSGTLAIASSPGEGTTVTVAFGQHSNGNGR